MENRNTLQATEFRSQHRADRMLLLPNIWDAVSAQMVVAAGFPSVATASIATAIANGYADGEQIPFSELTKIIGRIAKAVDVPISVDMEKGFAQTTGQLQKNVSALLDVGAVGLNIEDALPGYKGFYTVDEMRGKIAVIREAGLKAGIPVVINARTDVFLVKPEGDLITLAIERANAYATAGADCVYPILINSYEAIQQIISSVSIPLNVALLPEISDLKKLEMMGVARVSLGPGLFNYALTKIRTVSENLMNYDAESLFSAGLMPQDVLRSLV